MTALPHADATARITPPEGCLSQQPHLCRSRTGRALCNRCYQQMRRRERNFDFESLRAAYEFNKSVLKLWQKSCEDARLELSALQTEHRDMRFASLVAIIAMFIVGLIIGHFAPVPDITGWLR
jgi:hypothetical protein